MLIKARFYFPEILFGLLLAVAIFAMGMLFATSYYPRPATNNQSQQTKAAAQDDRASIPIVAEHTADSQTTQYKQEKSEFWSAKLTDWLLAFFTLFLVAFTAALVRSTNKLWSASREDFIATHRPRVVLRYIDGPYANDEGHQFIAIVFVNVGANDAVIDAFGGDLAYRGGFKEAWEIPGLDADLKEIKPVTLVCGQRHVFTVTARTDFNGTLVSKSAWPGFQTCAVGMLRYRDGNGISRHTGFFRVLDDEGASFVVSKHDSEMEYQD